MQSAGGSAKISNDHEVTTLSRQEEGVFLDAKSSSKKNKDNENGNDAFAPCNVDGNALTGNSPTPSASDCKDDDENRYNYDTVEEQDLPALVVRDAINYMRSDDTTVAPGFSSEVTGNSVMAGRSTVK